MQGGIHMRDELSLEFVSMISKPARKPYESKTIMSGCVQEEIQRPQVQMSRSQRRRKKIRRRRIRSKRIKKAVFRRGMLAVTVGMAVWFWGILWDNLGLKEVVHNLYRDTKEVTAVKGKGIPHPEWTEAYLTVNPYSRPGSTLPVIKDVFVHYTANPGTDAVQNRSYFEQLKDTKERAASAHFIIGYEGDIVLCVPLDEVAYAVKTRNYDSVSIECCYINADGSFTQETYDALIELLVWLLKEYDLDTDNILRHFDCGGKKCPLYYVENEEQWQRLKQDVAQRLNN